MEAEINMFEKNSVVCCLGSSETEHGYWIYDLNAYFAQERPQDNVVFYNCGAGGNVAKVVPTLLEEDVMWINPDYVILCYGGNDIGFYLYNPDVEVTEKVLEEREKRLLAFEKNFRFAAQLIKMRGAKPILAATLAYDDVQQGGAPVKPGAAEAIEKLAGIVRRLAKELDCPLIDFFKTTHEAKIEFGKRGERIFNDDRTHQNRIGHGIMAFTVLRDMGYDVKIPKTAKEWEQMRPYETKANNRRFMIEKKLREIAYIDYSWFNPLWKNARNEEEKIEKLLKIYSDPATDTWRKSFIMDWFKYRDKVDELRRMLVLETNSLVGSEREEMDADLLQSGLVFHLLGRD